jgi:hypothetical protein
LLAWSLAAPPTKTKKPTTCLSLSSLLPQQTQPSLLPQFLSLCVCILSVSVSVSCLYLTIWRNSRNPSREFQIPVVCNPALRRFLDECQRSASLHSLV